MLEKLKLIHYLTFPLTVTEIGLPLAVKTIFSKTLRRVRCIRYYFTELIFLAVLEKTSLTDFIYLSDYRPIKSHSKIENINVRQHGWRVYVEIHGYSNLSTCGQVQTPMFGNALISNHDLLFPTFSFHQIFCNGKFSISVAI